jgi:ketosteroid isomerase-like protein
VGPTGIDTAKTAADAARRSARPEVPATHADGPDTHADAPLTRADALSVAESYVAAYNDRDLEAMLRIQDEQVVSHPARLFGQRVLKGHTGVRAWWQTMIESDRWYEVIVHDVRLLEGERVAVFGELRERGEPLSPWGVVIRVLNGLIVESHSYLSDEQLLIEIGALDERRPS